MIILFEVTESLIQMYNSYVSKQSYEIRHSKINITEALKFKTKQLMK